MRPDDETTVEGRLFDGRYRMIRRIGSGGMARVFLAEDVDLHRDVAIKILHDRYSEDAQFVERFAREARAAAGLNHPNIVAIYDRGQFEGSYYIAMEYLDGETLKDVIVREGPLPERRAIDITLQLLAALRFAHRREIIHRDVKPHNVMVLRDGRVKVADFGIARAGDSEMTEAGSIVGTAQYLSPEQARGQHVGPESDLYSVGVVLYEMLTGRVPFTGDSAVAIAMKHVQETPVPPRQIVPAIPAELEAVVQRAMAKDPARRYHSADEMGMDLDRVRKGLGVTQATAALSATDAYAAAGRTMVAPPPPTSGAYAPAQAPTPPRRNWPWVVVLAAARRRRGPGRLPVPQPRRQRRWHRHRDHERAGDAAQRDRLPGRRGSRPVDRRRPDRQAGARVLVEAEGHRHQDGSRCGRGGRRRLRGDDHGLRRHRADRGGRRRRQTGRQRRDDPEGRRLQGHAEGQELRHRARGPGHLAGSRGGHRRPTRARRSRSPSRAASRR